MNNSYDEIKSLLKKSRVLLEADISQVNVAKDIETKINQDDEEETEVENSPKDKVQK